MTGHGAEATADVETIDTEPRQDPAPASAFQHALPAELDLSDAAVRSLAGSVDPRVMEALRYAGAELRAGVCESGDNGGVPLRRYVEWFGNYGPQPWCAFFVSWCWDNATDRNRRTPWDNPGWVLSVKTWASQHGKLVSRPQTGDVFGVGGDHMGWVWSASGSEIVTVEGNTSSGCVQSLRRSTSGLWFARIS